MASVCTDSNQGRDRPRSLKVQELVGPTSRRRTRGTSPLAGATNANSCLRHAACLKLALLNPQRLCELRLVASDRLDEALRVLASEEHVERVGP
jgi:hypothetical protein